jgi:hypothetical protein
VETLHDIWEAIRPHLSGIVLALTWLGIAFAYFRKRSQWRVKRFADQVNFSLNYVADGALQLRTLLETSTARVWPNEHGVRIVLAAAKKTRPDQPFIILDNPFDMAFVKRAALNVISEKFASWFLAASLGLPVKSALYHFAITFENFADMRTRKFRILLVEAKGLVEMFGPAAPEPAVLDPVHRDRLRVLQTMAGFAADPKADNRLILGRVQLGMPRVGES